MSGDLTARDVIAAAIANKDGFGVTPGALSDAVLAALAAAGWRLMRDEQWEWGVEHSQGRRVEPNEHQARQALQEMTRSHQRNHRLGVMAPRLARRHVSDWEVAPDA